eukprot:7570847-Ditylum_brightwellii.AAC.1
MLIHNTWQDKKLSSCHKRNIDDIVALKAELKRRDKIIKSYRQSLPSVASSRHNNKPHPTQVKTNNTSHNYTADAQVGPGKELSTKADFLAGTTPPPLMAIHIASKTGSPGC